MKKTIKNRVEELEEQVRKLQESSTDWVYHSKYNYWTKKQGENSFVRFSKP